MRQHNKKTLIFWVGLLIIAVLYGLYYIFFLYGISLDMPLRARHLLKFVFILLVYGVGFLCLRGFAEPWMLRTWHAAYLLILLVLLGLGGYDWLIARTPLALREIAGSLQDFLVSPLLYVGMRILGGKTKDGNTGA